MSHTVFLVSDLPLGLDQPIDDAYAAAKARLARLGYPTEQAEASLYRKSVDARKRDSIRLIVSIAVRLPVTVRNTEALRRAGIRLLPSETLPTARGSEPLSAPPVIVGSGPAGLFCALWLAEHGHRPVLLERGGSVDERRMAVERFSNHRVLDTETNIQFGAGGAGTFSDGKLVTRIGDPLTQHVLEVFVRFGAPREILYMAKPHIGTDILSAVVDRMLRRIEELGGRVMYHTRFLSVRATDGAISSIKTNVGEIPAGALVLAIGHSARDTYDYLMRQGLAIEPKPFSVGMRIEHRAADIDEAMYGRFAGHPALGHAEYTLSHNTKERGVYTFCMCPGGTVVAATSEEGQVVVNGMSEHARDGVNSNAAVLCSVFCEDFGNRADRAIELQRTIERAAFAAGGGTYAVPLTTVGDFLAGTKGKAPTRIRPSYMNGQAYGLAAVEEYLPDTYSKHLRDGLYAFDRRIRGFASPDALLLGAETRTSAPLRILRVEDTRTALGYRNLYPAGEGAGYAGGITSAAIDGLRTAIALTARYAPL